MLDSCESTYAVNLSNIDLNAQKPRGEGSWPDDGLVSVAVHLYPGGGPSFIARPTGVIVDRTRLALAIGELEVEHWRRTDGAPDFIAAHQLMKLPDGRAAVVFGFTLAPFDDSLVLELLGILTTIAIQPR